MKKMLVVMLAMVLFYWLAGVKISHADDLDNVLSAYGRPDSSDSTEFDNPRPLLITKWLIYKKQGVRFTFLREGERWKLFGLQDSITLKPLTAAEVQRRFGR